MIRFFFSHFFYDPPNEQSNCSHFVNLVWMMAAESVSKFTSVIMAMRVNEISDRALFTDLAQEEQQLKKCIDTTEDAEFSCQREMAKLIGSWHQAKTQSEVKRAAGSSKSSRRARGNPRHGLEQSHGEVPTDLQSRPLRKRTSRSKLL